MPPWISTASLCGRDHLLKRYVIPISILLFRKSDLESRVVCILFTSEYQLIHVTARIVIEAIGCDTLMKTQLAAVL